MLFDLNYWCHKILPLVYDDSLSYYEVLCKLTSKIGDMATEIASQFAQVDNNISSITTDIDNINSEIEGLKKTYTELQHYVDNYFADLDIQTEINNKINTMVQSGEFQTVLAPGISMATERATQVGSAYAKIIASCARIGVKTTGAKIKADGGFKIVAVGNSITYGAGSVQTLTWADRIAFDLQNVARTLGLTYEYTNMAIGGSALNQTYADDFYPSILGRDLPWAEDGKTWKDSILAKQPNIILTSFGMNDGGGLSNTVTAGQFYQELLQYNTTFSANGATMCYLNDIAPKDSTSPNTSDIFVRNKISIAQEMRDFANTNRTINFFDSFALSHLLQWGVDSTAYERNPITMANYAGHNFNNGALSISYRNVPTEESNVADVYVRRYNATKTLTIRPVDGVARTLKIYLNNTSVSGALLASFTVDSWDNIHIVLFDNWIIVNGVAKWFANAGYYYNSIIQPRVGAEDYIVSLVGESYDNKVYTGVTGTPQSTVNELMADARHPTAYGQSMMLYAAIAPWVNEIYTQLRNA